MKTTVIFLALVMGVITNAFQGFAHGEKGFGSEVIISSANGRNFEIVVDGYSYKSQNGILVLSDFREGNYTFTVIRHKQDRYRSYTVRTNNVIYIPERSKVNISCYGTNLSVNNITALYTPKSHNHHCMPEAMSYEEFKCLKERVNYTYFDSDKVNVIETALYNNYFTSYQVAELMNMLSFEDSKLYIAKKAYDRTINKYEYSVVYDALSFYSSKDDLARYTGIQCNEAYVYKR